MLMRYWQAALMAAIMTLLGNVVWAQTAPGDGHIGLRPQICQQGKCCAVKFSCTTGECCKDGKCCKGENCSKDGECCCKGKKCDEKCTCCKDNKCECCKGSECCCGKSGKCCCKEKTNDTKTGCCPFMSQMAKRVAIIMVIPSPIPMFGGPHVEAMGLPHPPLPVPTHVVMPTPFPPPPPMLTPPGMPVPTLNAPYMPPQTVALSAPQPGYYSCPIASADMTGPMPTKVNAGAEGCLQLMGLASDLCFLARTPNMPSLCMAALGLLSDLCPASCALCPATCAQDSPQYVTYPPQYIPPSPPFPATSGCHANGNPCVVGCGAGVVGCGAGAVGAPIEIHTNCGLTGNMAFAVGQPTVVESYTVATPGTTSKIHIMATPSSDELEMNVGGSTCIRCKKMTVTLGENEIALSRFDDRVRVRGDELKATAASVRSDSKDRLILEGDVVLHYKKDGHSANITGDRIELNLSSGAVTIKPAAKTSSTSAVHIDRVDGDSK